MEVRAEVTGGTPPAVVGRLWDAPGSRRRRRQLWPAMAVRLSDGSGARPAGGGRGHGDHVGRLGDG